MEQGTTFCAATNILMNDIERMIRYDRWANLESVAALKSAGLINQKAVNIAGHIAGISEMWLARAEGANSTLAAWPEIGLGELEDWINQLSVRWLALIERAPKDLILTYCDSRGQKRTNGLTDWVLEVILHAAHHRGRLHFCSG